MGLPIQTVAAVLIFGLIGVFQIGFHAAIYNQLQTVMEAFVAKSLTIQFGESATKYVTIMFSLIVSSHAIGILISCFVLLQVLDDYGRKNTCYIMAVLNLAGSSMQALAYVFNLFELLILGRLFCGVACSCGIAANLIIISEIAPREFRGMVGAATHIITASAMIVANVVSFPEVLGSEHLWPYIFVINIIIVLIFMVLGLKFPESPRYLLAMKGRPDLALESLTFYNPPGADVDELLDKIAAETRGMKVEFATSKWRVVNFVNFLKTHRNFIGSAVVANLVALAFCFCGNFILLNFTVYILNNAGVPETISRYSSVGYCFVELLFSCFGAWLIESRGRRQMTLAGNWTTLICLTVIFINQTIEDNEDPLIHLDQTVLAVLSVVAILVHAGGKAALGSILNTMTSELFPSFVRASAVLYCNLVPLTACNIVLGLAYLPLEDQIGSIALLILLILPMLVVSIALAIVCPETKGKDVSDIMHETLEKGKAPADEEEIEVGKED